jgi:uncharacterized protein (TIGR02118 family)
MMIRFTVMYPKTAESTFDMDYYLTKHIPLLQERLAEAGLKDVRVDEGLAGGAPGEAATYATIFSATFEAMEGFQKGMGAHGAELRADVPNFTNVQPVVQVSRVRL